ncbi:MAG: cupin domain-containing protein [Solirubrobacterales bacterium]|nr:cupin domain-containing protein [Solirubrobacterales bacterium]MBV9423121.1 cupin domain-containing protein [Solirubrobacterales bacterium]MBV9799846.1 cupin domain-containing protein [Solirubrobacterales bacterium]
MALIVSSVRRQSQVIRGLHGGTGQIRVNYLAVGGVLFSDMQLFEWGEVPPGAGAARHTHTRTEELFLLLSGRAVVGLGADQREVGPGDAILTGRGGEHWITAIGDEPLSLLIFEAMPPEIADRLPAHSPVGDA